MRLMPAPRARRIGRTVTRSPRAAADSRPAPLAASSAPTLAELQQDVTGIADSQTEIDEGHDSGVPQWNRAYDRFGGATIGQYL